MTRRYRNAGWCRMHAYTTHTTVPNWTANYVKNRIRLEHSQHGKFRFAIREVLMRKMRIAEEREGKMKLGSASDTSVWDVESTLERNRRYAWPSGGSGGARRGERPAAPAPPRVATPCGTCGLRCQPFNYYSVIRTPVLSLPTHSLAQRISVTLRITNPLHVCNFPQIPSYYLGNLQPNATVRMKISNQLTANVLSNVLHLM